MNTNIFSFVVKHHSGIDICSNKANLKEHQRSVWNVLELSDYLLYLSVNLWLLMFIYIIYMFIQSHGVKCYQGQVFSDICDVMGQNQSHVAKHETAQLCILYENVKICPFFVFNKKEIFV